MQIGVRDLKDVDYFYPPVVGHVTRRMHSDGFIYRQCDRTFSTRNSVTDSRRIIKIGIYVRHEKRRTRSTLKVKRSKVKVTRSCDVVGQKHRIYPVNVTRLWNTCLIENRGRRSQ